MIGFKEYWDGVNPVLYDDECWFLDNCYIGSAEMDEDEALEKKAELEEIALNAFLAGEKSSEDGKLKYFQELMIAEEKIMDLKTRLFEASKLLEIVRGQTVSPCQQAIMANDFLDNPELPKLLGVKKDEWRGIYR